MKWYETQIIGVIIGGLITMIANWLLKWDESRRETKNIKAGVKAEILVCSKFLDYGIPTIQKLREEFETTAVIPELKMTGQFNFTFIDSNMSKFGALDTKLLVKIIELRSLHEAYIEGAKILFDSISLYRNGSFDSSLLRFHLTTL